MGGRSNCLETQARMLPMSAELHSDGSTKGKIKTQHLRVTPENRRYQLNLMTGDPSEMTIIIVQIESELSTPNQICPKSDLQGPP